MSRNYLPRISFGGSVWEQTLDWVAVPPPLELPLVVMHRAASHPCLLCVHILQYNL